MISKTIFTPGTVGLVAGLSFFTAFSGCAVEPTGGYRGRVQVEADFQDDYDYYPDYEIYYSRHRHEFVYLDDGVWVRRPEPPRGITINVIQVAPSVRLDFHDAPERHHSTVVRSYPRTWRAPEMDHPIKRERPDAQPERRDTRPEQPAVRQEPRHDVESEHREAAPEHPVVKPAPAETKPEHRASKPKAPVKKKIAPKDDNPNNKPEGKENDHKDDRKDDKRDEGKGPNRPGE